jgi:tRNA splicing endonuclease
VAGVLEQIGKDNDLSQNYLSIRDSFRKTWNNWLRLRKRRSVEELLKETSENERKQAETP